MIGPFYVFINKSAEGVRMIGFLPVLHRRAQNSLQMQLLLGL
jgi:hypothetical protein